MTNSFDYVNISVGKNLFGDVTELYQGATCVAKYKYDAWGAPTQTITQGCEELDVIHNPFMFKGYFYDEETGFYYLKSRYYAPVIGRFISMDAIAYMDVKSFNGVNLYSYCNNNPVMYADENGNLPTWVIIAAGAILGVSLITCAVLGIWLAYQLVDKVIIPAIKITKAINEYIKENKDFKKFYISDPYLAITDDGIAIVQDATLAFFEMDLYDKIDLDFKISLLNLQTLVGIPRSSISGNVLSIGFESKYFELNVEFLSISTSDVPKWVDLGLSINLSNIYKDYCN